MNQRSAMRVHYYDRQFLRPQEFIDEQSYHLSMHRRHNIGLHCWGIVSGLDIMCSDDGLALQPGYAIDGYGRDLVLTTLLPISPQEFILRETDALDVYLIYQRNDDDATSDHLACEDKSGTSFNRWTEQPRLRFEVPTGDIRNPRKSALIPEDALGFGPELTAPDETESLWPVYLARITRKGQSSNCAEDFSIDPSYRPYIGIVGTRVSSPSGAAYLQLEAEDGTPRFEVVFPQHAGVANRALIGTNTANRPEDVAEDVPPPGVKFRIDEAGTVNLAGDTTINGDLTLHAGALAFAGAASDAEVRAGWSVYRTRRAIKDDKDSANNKVIDAVRIALDSSSSDSELAIGFWSEDESKFKECFKVTGRGDVTVAGTMHVSQLSQTTDKDVRLQPSQASEEVARFVLSQFTSGLNAASGATSTPGGGSQVLGIAPAIASTDWATTRPQAELAELLASQPTDLIDQLLMRLKTQRDARRLAAQLAGVDKKATKRLLDALQTSLDALK